MSKIRKFFGVKEKTELPGVIVDTGVAKAVKEVSKEKEVVKKEPANAKKATAKKEPVSKKKVAKKATKKKPAKKPKYTKASLSKLSKQSIELLAKKEFDVALNRRMIREDLIKEFLDAQKNAS
jgi:cobalamin biosynthesis protein CobT